MDNPKDYVDEDSKLAPVSLYAELKVKFEKYMLSEMKRTDEFSPTSLRFSTVYGLSSRMRFDLTVNEFTKDLALGKELIIFGEQFWRPYCHLIKKLHTMFLMLVIQKKIIQSKCLLMKLKKFYLIQKLSMYLKMMIRETIGLIVIKLKESLVLKLV